MTIYSPISNYAGTYPYGNLQAGAVSGAKSSLPENSGQLSGTQTDDSRLPGSQENESILPGLGEDDKKKKGIEDPFEECQTCKRRKYQDGSDEMVSFKSAAHISPEAAASAVRAHEQEHVSNAYKKASTDNGKVINASVSIHTAICPECGRTYVSGGTTHTQIKYYNEDNPYQKDLKSADRTKYVGMNADYAV